MLLKYNRFHPIITLSLLVKNNTMIDFTQFFRRKNWKLQL